MPKDGLPVIGRIKDSDGLYLFAMHSGVTLAAVTGRLAAAEILTGQDEMLLFSYRPQRFSDVRQKQNCHQRKVFCYAGWRISLHHF